MTIKAYGGFLAAAMSALLTMGAVVSLAHDAQPGA